MRRPTIRLLSAAARARPVAEVWPNLYPAQSTTSSWTPLLRCVTSATTSVCCACGRQRPPARNMSHVQARAEQRHEQFDQSQRGGPQERDGRLWWRRHRPRLRAACAPCPQQRAVRRNARPRFEDRDAGPRLALRVRSSVHFIGRISGVLAQLSCNWPYFFSLFFFPFVALHLRQVGVLCAAHAAPPPVHVARTFKCVLITPPRPLRVWHTQRRRRLAECAFQRV